MADVLVEILPGHGGKSLDIATAYFNIRGFTLLQEGLQDMGSFRLLLGDEPQDGESVGLRPRAASRLIQELNAAPFDEPTLRAVEDLLADRSCSPAATAAVAALVSDSSLPASSVKVTAAPYDNTNADGHPKTRIHAYAGFDGYPNARTHARGHRDDGRSGRKPYTLNEVKDPAPAGIFGVNEGKRLIALDITQVGISDGGDSYNPLYFAIQDTDGYVYTPGLADADVGPPFGSGELAADQIVRGWVVFELPN